MAKHDLTVIGLSAGARRFRVAASSTRAYAGEPIEFNGTYSSGIATANEVVAAADATPVIGTDNFVGILHENFDVNSSGTVTAQWTRVIVPIANATRIEGKAKTTTNIDTESELIGVLWDLVLFDLTNSVYTIDETGAADTSGLKIVDGTPAKGLIQVTVDDRAFRADIT